ncbi:hypothetical protein [Cytobacillus gottheilii]|uniref:hypothetical protein n=1 Tax=Cytobacillus gottheilii TaxID=859144 RepID=UPI0009BB21C5|nr:hypothetical protein [Cytobacillus gottheilii]
MKSERNIINNYLFSAEVDEQTPPDEFAIDIALYSDDLTASAHAFKINSFDDLIYFFENVDHS